MLQKANDARMASGVRQSNIRLIGPAEPATRPYKPNLPLNLILGTLGGLVLAIGCVLLQEQNTSVLTRRAKPNVVWTGRNSEPYLALARGSGLRGVSSKTAAESSAPRGRCWSSGLRRCRSLIAPRWRRSSSAPHDGEALRSLVFTSSQPMEGKTTVVSNLGLALAEAGRKVLLVDGDMRRPKVHKVFEQANGWGLSDVLREWDTLEDLPLKVLVKKTAVPDLCILPGGQASDNILGLLYSGRMQKLLARFREEFDYVLVDAPPCLEFGDARSMARYTDGLVLVVRASYTGRKTAQAAVQRLERDGSRVTGVILNGWDSSRNEPYGRLTFRGLSPRGTA